ncbi:hypothetical protein [uncultured Fusobacterium sp.]|uniref:hypothetical protein n=1 Tax=uncultured Fusobacterium sp. TaxID=159267 RepID=UPI0027DCAE25|nr:hypothetical protein [uncultured Fusobacterium sp.]
MEGKRYEVEMLKGKNYDITSIFLLKKLKYLDMLLRCYNKEQFETLRNELPDTKIL